MCQTVKEWREDVPKKVLEPPQRKAVVTRKGAPYSGSVRQQRDRYLAHSASQQGFQHNSLFDLNGIVGKDSLMEKDRTTPAALWAYEASLFRQAWAEISAASFWRSVGIAVVSFFLQWWAGFRPLDDTLIMVAISLGSGLVIFLCEFAFRLLQAPAKMMHQAEEKVRKLEAEKAVREAFVVAPKKFSPACDLKIYAGGFDAYTMQDTISEASLGVSPAVVKIRCHNLSATPVILETVELLNADTGEVVVRQDAKAQRVDANSSCEIDIPFGSTAAPCRQPPPWRGQIRVETVRNQVFLSSPFNFGELV